MILKVMIYAYSRDIYSSRSIAQELKTDTAFMFLPGLQSPEFRTICLFRAENADVLSDLYVELVRLYASLGMVGLGHIAFDGTKLKANASVRQTRDRTALRKRASTSRNRCGRRFRHRPISTSWRTRYTPMVMAQR